jgi:hypothetical protein
MSSELASEPFGAKNVEVDFEVDERPSPRDRVRADIASRR